MESPYVAEIRGVGTYLPKTRETLAARAEKTGVGVPLLVANFGGIESVPLEKILHPTEMATVAATEALADAKRTADELDLVVFANSGLTDHGIWSPGARVCQQIGAQPNTQCVDMADGCTGVIQALDLVRNRMVVDDRVQTALIVASERASATFHEPQRELASTAHMADGAGALVVTRRNDSEPGLTFGLTRGACDGRFSASGAYPWGGTRYWLEQWEDSVPLPTSAEIAAFFGPEGDYHGVAGRLAREVLEDHGLALDRVRCVVLNQNKRTMLEQTAAAIPVRGDLVFDDFARLGHLGLVDHVFGIQFARGVLREHDDVAVLVASAKGFKWVAMPLVFRGVSERADA